MSIFCSRFYSTNVLPLLWNKHAGYAILSGWWLLIVGECNAIEFSIGTLSMCLVLSASKLASKEQCKKLVVTILTWNKRFRIEYIGTFILQYLIENNAINGSLQNSACNQKKENETKRKKTNITMTILEIHEQKRKGNTMEEEHECNLINNAEIKNSDHLLSSIWQPSRILPFCLKLSLCHI